MKPFRERWVQTSRPTRWWEICRRKWGPEIGNLADAASCVKSRKVWIETIKGTSFYTPGKRCWRCDKIIDTDYHWQKCLDPLEINETIEVLLQEQASRSNCLITAEVVNHTIKPNLWKLLTGPTWREYKKIKWTTNHLRHLLRLWLLLINDCYNKD